MPARQVVGAEVGVGLRRVRRGRAGRGRLGGRLQAREYLVERGPERRRDERVLDWSGVPTTHLRPTFFAEWLLPLAEPIARDGILALPFGEGRHAPVAAADQAHVIAAILDDPAPHAGQTYPLFGPVEMDQHAIAAEVGRALGRPVRYTPITPDQFADWLTARGQSAHLIQHLRHVARDYQAGRFAGHNDVVPRIGGVPGTSVGQFVAQHRRAFSP